MYRYFHHKDIDKKLWDKCIDQSKNGIIYALSWYLDITSPGWDAIIKEEEGNYVAVLPLPRYRKFGLRYIKQPLFSQQLGIIHQSNMLDVADIQDMARLIKKNFNYVTAFKFNTENKILLDHGLPGFSQETHHTHHIDLKKTYNKIVSGYKADRRWRINKAKRSNIKVETSEEIDILIKIFNDNVAPKIYGLVGEKYEYRILRALFEATKCRNMCTLLAAKNDNGEILAMGLFFRYNSKIIYIFNASTSKGKRLSAISLVVDKVLQEHANQHLCFDFESPEISHVAEFYRRFGSSAIPFASVSYNNLPFPVRVVKTLRARLYKTFIGKR